MFRSPDQRLCKFRKIVQSIVKRARSIGQLYSLPQVNLPFLADYRSSTPFKTRKFFRFLRPLLLDVGRYRLIVNRLTGGPKANTIHAWQPIIYIS